MKLKVLFVSAVIVANLSGSAFAQNACLQCVKEKLGGAKEKTLATAVLGAIAGAKVGNLAGAVCGAVIGAAGAAVDKLIEVAQCDDICLQQAAAAKDKGKCEDLMTKTKN